MRGVHLPQGAAVVPHRQLAQVRRSLWHIIELLQGARWAVRPAPSLAAALSRRQGGGRAAGVLVSAACGVKETVQSMSEPLLCVSV